MSQEKKQPKLNELKRKFPDVPIDTIKYFIKCCPKMYETVIKKYTQNVLELKDMFSDKVIESTLRHIAISHRANPIAAVYIYLANCEMLKTKFPYIDSNILTHYAISNLNAPVSAVQKYIETCHKLKIEFPVLNDGIIKFFAFNYQNSQLAVKNCLQKGKDLIEKYPNVEEINLWVIARRNAKNPEAAVENLIQSVNELKSKYPDMKKSLLERFAVDRPRNPEGALIRYLEKYKNRRKPTA